MRTVTVTTGVTKRCPYRDERDDGTLTLTFRVTGDAPELHGLAKQLAATATEALSHEDYTQTALDSWAHAGCIAASTTWHTAGMEVTVDVPSDQHHT